MMEDKKESYKKFLDTWKLAEPMLDALRIRDIRNTDTKKALEFLMPAFDSALKYAEKTTFSGLVDQQKYFRKFANR